LPSYTTSCPYHPHTDTPMSPPPLLLIHLFFFNAPATTEIYTLSLHDALPILRLAISCWRTPASIRAACCSSVFTGTNCIVGRPIASHVPSASRPSFLFRLT